MIRRVKPLVIGMFSGDQFFKINQDRWNILDCEKDLDEAIWGSVCMLVGLVKS